jgi:hypothetical protein
MKMRLAILFLVSAFAGLSVQASAEWMLDGKAKVYLGDHGVRVTIVSLRPRGENQVLIAFEGTTSRLDDNVLLHKVNTHTGGQDFYFELEGYRRRSVVSRSSWWSDNQLYLYVPGRPHDTPIHFSAKESKEDRGPMVLDRFLNRKTKPLSGKFKREAEIKLEEKEFSEKISVANVECGLAIKGEVDWPSIDDALLKKLHVSQACGQVVTTLTYLCDDEIGKEAVSSAIGEIQCRVGPELGIELSNRRLIWTTAIDTPFQEDFAYKYLNENL